MSQNLRGYAYAALSSSSYGVNAFAVLLYTSGLTSDTVLFYRYLFAILVMLGLMVARRHSFGLTLREFALACPMGLLFAYSSLSLFESYKYMDVSLAATVLFVYPALVALTLWVAFRERPSKMTLAAIPAVFVGIVLLDWEGISGGGSSLVGMLLVLSSALSYAIYMVVVQKSCLSAMPSLKLGFYSLFFGFFLFLFKTKFGVEVQPLTTPLQWVIALALAIFPSFISLSSMALAIRYVGSTATAVLGAFEPLTSVLIGVCLFGERPAPVSWVGMIVILLSVTTVVAQNRIVRLGGRLVDFVTGHTHIRRHPHMGT